MHRGGHTGAAAERVFEVRRAAVLLEEIAERFVGQFLKVLHLVVAEKVELPPGRFVELHTLARHRSPFFSFGAASQLFEASTFWPRESTKHDREKLALGLDPGGSLFSERPAQQKVVGSSTDRCALI